MLDDPNLWVVLTLREDYVAALDPYAPLLFNRLRARFYMERMGVDAGAGRGPQAGRAGGPALCAPAWPSSWSTTCARCASPARRRPSPGQYVEPVQLQVVCYQLWENLGRGRTEDGTATTDRRQVQITLDDLAEAGDVDRALTQFYEETLAAVLADPAAAGVSERQLRAWFDEELITEAGTRGLVHQGEQRDRQPAQRRGAGLAAPLPGARRGPRRGYVDRAGARPVCGADECDVWPYRDSLGVPLCCSQWVLQ